MKMKRKGNEDEVKMTMRWKLLNQDAKRGTQKKKEGANTNTWNLAQNGQPWKGKGKENRRPTENGTRPAEEGEDRSAWTNLRRRKPYINLSTQRAKPTWREENARTHEIGTHGELVNDMMHPHRRAIFPSLGSMARVQVTTLWTADVFNPWITCTISTSPNNQKRSDQTWKACPVTWSCQNGCGLSLDITERRLSWLQATNPCILGKWWSHMQRPVVQHSLDRRVKQWKMASSSLYLNELLIQKCKFRHRVTVNC